MDDSNTTLLLLALALALRISPTTVILLLLFLEPFTATLLPERFDFPLILTLPCSTFFLNVGQLRCISS